MRNHLSGWPVRVETYHRQGSLSRSEQNPNPIPFHLTSWVCSPQSTSMPQAQTSHFARALGSRALKTSALQKPSRCFQNNPWFYHREELKQDLNKWKTPHVHMDWKTVLLRWQCSLVDLQIPGDPHQNHSWPLCRNWRGDPTIQVPLHRTEKSQQSRKGRTSWETGTFPFQNSLQSSRNRDSVELALARQTDQWARTESPEIMLPVYGQVIFNKGAKTIQCEKTVSSRKGQLDIATKLKNGIAPFPHTI